MANSSNISYTSSNDQAWLLAIADRLPQYVAYCGMDRRFLYVNPKYAQWFALRPKDLLGKTLQEVSHSPEDYGRIKPHEDRAFAGELVHFEVQLAEPKGDIVSFRVDFIPQHDPATGQMTGVITIGEDVTDQENTLKALTEAKIAAEEANRAKSAFLANMSHEIRTPLGAILGFSSLMKDNLPRGERIKFGEIIDRNGKMLTRIIDDLLDLARVESGRLAIDRVKFPVRELIDDVIGLFTDKADEKQISLARRFEGTVPIEVESDPVRFRQILINLLGNAIKFTERGGVFLRVEARPADNGQVRLSFVVKDTGCGISEQERPRLFQPFSQADDSSTRPYAGSGLGLALSSRLATALGGTVELQSSVVGKGSTFVFSLLTRATLGTGAVEDIGAIPEELVWDRQLIGIKVLAVDDCPDNLELVRHLLVSRGATVDTASSGSDALTLARKNCYDIALMDIQMPQMDGYETFENLRRDGFERPIVALTAHAMEEERKRALEAGFAHHLTKPLNVSEFFNVVAQKGRPESKQP